MLGSTTSAVLYTSKLIAFAQKSRNSALQTGYQPSIDHLADLIHNKTGIDEVSVKPILEQMAVQILKTKGMVPLNNTIASLTHVVKRPYTDIVSLSIYKLASDQAAGNRSGVDQANPTAPLAQVAIQLTGGLSLTKKIDQLTTELENSTGADATSVKQILNLLTLLTADVFTNQDAKNTINQIAGAVKANPMGLFGQALTQLSQVHFTGTKSILQLVLLGHESIPVAITSEALRTIGGYHMDWEIYKIANETHSKFGIAFDPVEQVLQLSALEIGNTGGHALSYNTVNNLTKMAAEDPAILQSIFQLGKAQAAGNTMLVNLHIAQFSQQIDNGEKAIQTLKTINPPDVIQNPSCIQEPKSLGCNYISQFSSTQTFTRVGSQQLAAKILQSVSHKFTIPAVITNTYHENAHQNLSHSIAYWKPSAGLFADERLLNTQQSPPQNNTNSDPVAQINNGMSNSNNTGLSAKVKGCLNSPQCVKKTVSAVSTVSCVGAAVSTVVFPPAQQGAKPTTLPKGLRLRRTLSSK
jgi:hypothetical protein